MSRDRLAYVIRCGCGTRLEVKSLYRETRCPSCRWPLVYGTGPRTSTISHHASLTIELREVKPKRVKR